MKITDEKPIRDWKGRTDHRGRHAMQTVGGCKCLACSTAQFAYLAQAPRT